MSCRATAAATTSCVEGGLFCCSWDPLCAPGSNMATALAGQHHLRYQAALTLPRSALTSERDCPQGRPQRKPFVSSDHLSPTSPAITTIRTRPFLPWSSAGSSLCSCVLPAGRPHLCCHRSFGGSHTRRQSTPKWSRRPMAAPEE